MRMSVIIPVKNEERNLERLLPALLEQSHPPEEILVAIAPSTTDRSREVTEKYHPDAVWVEGGMPGPGRNKGARHAHGELLLFLDADVLPGDAYLLRDIRQDMRERSLDVATVDHVGIDTSIREKAYFAIFNAAQRVMSHSKRPFGCGTIIAAKRDVHERIGGFDERWAFYEDSDYIQRAVHDGYRFAVLDRPAYVRVDPRRLRKDGIMPVLKNGIRADRYARKHGVITDIGLIDKDYFDHDTAMSGTERKVKPRFPTRLYTTNEKIETIQR
ncbi:TPA: glycosyltransferase [Candidatus Woesearchaeota archaeon]|nr:glycosyltransferase [Candidatus Woesearchaeota archaeon]